MLLQVCMLASTADSIQENIRNIPVMVTFWPLSNPILNQIKLS